MTVIHCKSYGVPLQVKLFDESLLPRLRNLLPFGTVIGTGPEPDAEVFILSAEVPVEQFSRDVMVHVANHAPDRVFLHAGVVGWRGRALLLPGPSFAGKSTLTAALVQAGATYYSDEYALIDNAGWVHPYARDLQMRAPGHQAQTSLPVSRLHGRAGRLPLRVAKVIFSEYRANAYWDPQPVARGMAVLEMLRHCIPVQRTPARVMSTLGAMLQDATAWSSARGDAAIAARILLGSLDEQRASLPHQPAPVQSVMPS